MPAQAFSQYGRLARPLPLGTGKVFVVTPSSSSLTASILDQYKVDEDGVARVFANDIAGALSASVSGRGDTILIIPGTYTITTVLTNNLDNVRMIGLTGSTGGSTVSLQGSAADILTTQGDGGIYENLSFVAASAQVCVQMNAASGNLFRNCLFEGVGGAASRCIRMATTACNFNKFEDCYFWANLTTAAGIVTQTALIANLGSNNWWKNCGFQAHRTSTANAGAVTTGILSATATDFGNRVTGCTFAESNGATFTAGIDYGTTSLGGSFIVHESFFQMATAANAIVNGTNAGEFGNNKVSGTI